MSIYNGIDGSVLAVTKVFLDDDDAPLMARPGYPQVRLRDTDKNLLSQTIGSPSATPGVWQANVAVPNLGLLDKTEFRLSWVFKTTDNEKIVETDAVILEPKSDNRVSDIVAMYGDQKFSLTVPMFIAATDVAAYQIFAQNAPVLASPGDLADTALFQRTTTVDRTNYQIPLTVPQPSLYANLLMLKVTPTGALQEKVFTYSVWAITPQIALAMKFLEDFLNKSRIENVIPELQYTAGDLMAYLERGLNLFNMVQQPTYFNGLNMQGVIFDAWVTCASYYALGAQMQAEGSLAFDFSGQGISLNVDRTPSLETALGRIESMINDRVVPLKKYLSKQGVVSGDGAVGSKNMNRPSSMGILEVSNAPTTRINGMTGFTGRRGWGW